MLTAVVWIAAFFLVIVAAIGAGLALPVRLRCRFDSGSEPRFRCEVRAVAGLIRFELPRSHGPSQELAAETAGDRQARGKAFKSRKGRRRRGGAGSWLQLLRDRDLRRRVRSFVGRGFHAVHVDLREAVFVYGFDDPADTGTLFAALLGARNLIGDRLGANVTLTPDFSEPRLEVRARGEVWFAPIRLAIPFAALGFAVWRARRRLHKRPAVQTARHGTAGPVAEPT